MKKIFITLAALVVAAFAGLMLSGFLNSMSNSGLPSIDPVEMQSFDDFSTGESGSTETSTAKENDENGYEGWHQIIPEGESNLDHTGYDELELYAGTTYAEFAEQFNGNGDWSTAYGIPVGNYTTSTGHKIYVNTTDYSEEAANTSRDGFYGSPYYILCGNALLQIDYKKQIPEDAGYLLREAGNGTRIRLYSTQEELDAANERYEKGQAVLNGTEEAKQGMIVLDGQLISAQWQKDANGDVILPFANVAKAYSEGTNITTEGILCVPLDEPRGIFISIPSKDTAGWDAGKTLHVNGASNSWTYTPLAVPGDWSEDFPLTNRDFNISALEVVKLMGWDIYTDGVVVNIVTDEYNDNDNFILRQ